ncbi:MAG: plasmid mobilization relaxosome protein MobC [Defluviitaleaceae bacterium]|nr:plasmid mobilization relaxosome protein MobC [Defluviitaleaceae bacterium]
MSKNRTRNNRVVFCLNDEELQCLEQKMEKLGVKNREGFIRKMVMDGYIINIDTSPTAELVRLVRNSTGNINQVSKRANESGCVYEDDVLEILAEHKRIISLAVEAHKNTLEMLRK